MVRFRVKVAARDRFAKPSSKPILSRESWLCLRSCSTAAGIPVSLWFISRNKQQAGKTVFIDARNLGSMVTRKLRELMPDTDIKKISDAFHAFQQGTLEDEKGFCAVCTTEQIAAQDFILTPGRYVGIAEDEGDGVPFEEKMTNLTGELKQLFEESKKQEEYIRLQLKKIGWEV